MQDEAGEPKRLLTVCTTPQQRVIVCPELLIGPGATSVRLFGSPRRRRLLVFGVGVWVELVWRLSTPHVSRTQFNFRVGWGGVLVMALSRFCLSFFFLSVVASQVSVTLPTQKPSG